MTADILNMKFESYDLGREVTIKGYFVTLLKTLWKEKEGFDGKRPFGNSDWEYDLYAGLIKNNLIPGKLDKDGYVDEINKKAAHEFVLNEIIGKL